MIKSSLQEKKATSFSYLGELFVSCPMIILCTCISVPVTAERSVVTELSGAETVSVFAGAVTFSILSSSLFSSFGMAIWLVFSSEKGSSPLSCFLSN
jgi:hypothetical protein